MSLLLDGPVKPSNHPNIAANSDQEVPQRLGVVPDSHHQQVCKKSAPQPSSFTPYPSSVTPDPSSLRTTRINVNGILIEYEGEDSGIGMLFASKAAVQVDTTLCYTLLHYTALCFTTLHYATLCYTMLNHTMLHYATLHTLH